MIWKIRPIKWWEMKIFLLEKGEMKEERDKNKHEKPWEPAFKRQNMSEILVPDEPDKVEEVCT